LHDILNAMTASITPLSTTDRVRIKDVETLSNDWYVLKKKTFDFLHNDGTWQQQAGSLRSGKRRDDPAL
jgi:hypothetical protein